ncbi:hypothetical protein FIBSPDRAFT_962904 [Athelia psychrophila]|uniref:DUF6533 domain-containing protein n=1 Tax=Athelia psychrophila TaxID=1759441 RepID=A0A165ZL96_9AGAM|nr:hypothetical protein FIBSPDRAFT_962904 [Fibularhizoctonia sp. CBS 109695]
MLKEARVTTYIHLCALMILAWDWFISLAEEYQTVKKRRGPSFSVLVYYLARTSTAVLCALSFIFNAGMLTGHDSCAGIFQGVAIMTTVASAAKSYLFLLRVRAVYGNSKLVTLIATAGWLVVVCSRATISYLVQTAPWTVEQTDYCMFVGYASITVVSVWLNLGYDTCIFIAISVRLRSYMTSKTKLGFLAVVRGYGLPRTMRQLLHDGQLYYCTTVIVTLFAAIVAVSPPHSPLSPTAFTIPAIAVETNMACKVFRAMILRTVDIEQNESTAEAECTLTAVELDAWQPTLRAPGEV